SSGPICKRARTRSAHSASMCSLNFRLGGQPWPSISRAIVALPLRAALAGEDIGRRLLEHGRVYHRNANSALTVVRALSTHPARSASRMSNACVVVSLTTASFVARKTSARGGLWWCHLLPEKRLFLNVRRKRLLVSPFGKKSCDIN